MKNVEAENLKKPELKTHKNLCRKMLTFINLNETQAAIRAGYKVDNARQTATENLAKPYISEAIEKALAERSRRAGINQNRTF